MNLRSAISKECKVRQGSHCLAAFISALVFLTACAHMPDQTILRIDGSTPEAFQTSWDRLHHSLTPHQQSQLDLAILAIALGKYAGFSAVPPSLLEKGIGPQTIRADIDGLSFKEIIDLASRQPIKMNEPHHIPTSWKRIEGERRSFAAPTCASQRDAPSLSAA